MPSERGGLRSLWQALRQDPPREPDEPREPLPEWVERETGGWDGIDRLTWRVARWMAAFFPTWYVLLAILGATGGPLLPLFTVAVLGAGVIAWLIERRWTARREGRSRGRRRGRLRLSPAAAAAMGGGAVLVVIYMVWVLSTAS